MSPKGNDLVRHYLWNAARSASTHNPAIRALYRRLRAKGTRGDVALGHCMRKLLHLVYAVWKTNRPFDPEHFSWEQPRDTQPSATTSAATDSAADGANHSQAGSTTSANDKAVGHKRDEPAQEVVTTAASTVVPTAAPVKPAPQPTPTPAKRVKIDFAFLRQQVTMEQVLEHLGLLDQLRGRGQQRRGPCPIHGQSATKERTFSAHLGKNIFQCFHADCRAQGNVLDFWAAVHRLPLYEAALHLADTFQLQRNREEEPVRGTRRARQTPCARVAENE